MDSLGEGETLREIPVPSRPPELDPDEYDAIAASSSSRLDEPFGELRGRLCTFIDDREYDPRRQLSVRVGGPQSSAKFGPEAKALDPTGLICATALAIKSKERIDGEREREDDDPEPDDIKVRVRLYTVELGGKVSSHIVALETDKPPPAKIEKEALLAYLLT